MKTGKIIIAAIFSFLMTIGVYAESFGADIEPSALKYFQESYEACRDRFRALAAEINKRNDHTRLSRVQVPSGIDGDLTIDICYLPARKKDKLMIISSGVHGVEGYTGSALQQMFIREILPDMNIENIGIVLIHAMNPYGFKYARRVTENNVDLNRNCDVDTSLFTTKNEGYSKLNDFLNPEGKVNTNSFGNQFFFLRAVIKILQESMQSLRQSILQGQYEFKRGLYFGGDEFEPQVTSIKPILAGIIDDYRMVFEIDLHTGYGARSRLHLFPNPVEDPKIRSAMEQIFDGYRIDWGDTEDFYTITGDFTGFVGKIVPGKFHIPMVFEFGTMDSQTTSGSVRSIHNMILENQGFHYGYKSQADEAEVKKRFREMFFPSSNEWRSEVIRQTRTIFPIVIERYQNLSTN